MYTFIFISPYIYRLFASIEDLFSASKILFSFLYSARVSALPSVLIFTEYFVQASLKVPSLRRYSLMTNLPNSLVECGFKIDELYILRSLS